MDFLQIWQKDIGSAGWTTGLSTFIDVILVAAVVYQLILLSKRTRAWQIIIGLVVFLLLVFVTERLQLHTLNFLLRQVLPLGPLAIVLLFYPELRHMLENMGRGAGWFTALGVTPKENAADVIQSIVRAACRMSEKRVGALIVIQREGALDDIAATGTALDAEVSVELLGTVFHPGSPLHDGAVIVRNSRIIAAGCTLPLSESAHVGTMVHTRHKAALGVAEESDAAVVVVSEETGTISLALEGKLHRGLGEESLTRWLNKVSGIANKRGEKSDLADKVNGTIRKARSKLR